MAKITVLSHILFDEFCHVNNINDDNVNERQECFISIIGTKENIKKYLKTEDKHLFRKNHKNVLNLNFDDVPKRSLTYKGVKFKGITKNQAKQLYYFIEKNKGKDFIIHCLAGISRSQGVCRYIVDMYQDLYNERSTNIKLRFSSNPNAFVVSELKKMFYKKNNFYK